MHVIVALSTYVVAIPLWFFVWWWIGGFSMQRRERMLILPNALCITFLAINLALVMLYGEVGSVGYEEGRFSFIQDRAMIVVQATASVLIVAVLVYGLTVRRVPVEFIRFLLYAFVFLLGVMAPIIWVPIEQPGFFYVLRHFQSVALIFSLFLCVAGIIILLRDIMTAGGVEIDLGKDNNGMM